MNRRELIALLGFAVTPWPRFEAIAQQAGKSYRIGVLAAGARPTTENPPWTAFKQGLRELGYVEGGNLVLESRFAGTDLQTLPGFASELAAMRVDAIVVLGPAPMRAAKRQLKAYPS